LNSSVWLLPDTLNNNTSLWGTPTC
jgi:hypothetical protein